MLDDIHDIRPPVMVGLDPALVKTGLWTAGGVLVVTLLAFGIWYVMRRRRKTGPEVASLHKIPPYDSAIQALDRLAAEPVHDAKAFYFDLGRILKAYLGTSYGVNCLEMTTQELGRWIRTLEDLPGSLKSETSLFQDLCDPFRYAPLTPNQAQVTQDLVRGRDLICAVEKARSGRTESERMKED